MDEATLTLSRHNDYRSAPAILNDATAADPMFGGIDRHATAVSTRSPYWA